MGNMEGNGNSEMNTTFRSETLKTGDVFKILNTVGYARTNDATTNDATTNDLQRTMLQRTMLQRTMLQRTMLQRTMLYE
jgi:hypothetical protein